MEEKDDEKESYEVCGQDHSLWPLALQWKKQHSCPHNQPVLEEKEMTPEQMVKKARGEYEGIQSGPAFDYVVWSDPTTKSTLMLPVDGLTWQKIHTRMMTHRKWWKGENHARKINRRTFCRDCGRGGEES